MPSQHLKEIYQSGVAERSEYLDNAEALAVITLPELRVKGSASSFSINKVYDEKRKGRVAAIYNNAGTLALAGLASTMQAVHFPNQVDWFRLSFDASMEAALIRKGITNQQKKDEAIRITSNRVKEKLAQLNYQAAVGRINLRLLVEDNVLVVVDSEQIRVMPLRSMTCRRYGGKLAWVCYLEQVQKDGSATELENQYTWIDYQNGEVWQQKESAKQARRVRMSPKQAFVVTSTVPEDTNYVCSFGFRHYGLIYAINNFSFHLHRAAAIASKAIMLIRPESGLTADDFADLQGGMALEGDPEAVAWLNAGMAINQWEWVMNYINELKQQLSKGFALDLLSQPYFAQPRSATEVALINQSVDQHVASLAQTTQNTLVKPLVEAVLEVLKQEPKNPSEPDLLEELTPIVTSGTSQFDALVQFQKLLQGFAMAAQFDNTLVARIDSLKLLQKWASITGVDVEDYIRELPPNLPMQGLPAPQNPSNPQPPLI